MGEGRDPCVRWKTLVDGKAHGRACGRLSAQVREGMGGEPKA